MNSLILWIGFLCHMQKLQTFEDDSVLYRVGQKNRPPLHCSVCITAAFV